MGVKISIEGIPQTRKYLSSKRKDISEGASVALQESTILLKQEVKASIKGERSEKRSVDTGAFLRSISSNKSPDSVSVFSVKSYAQFLEFGTRRFAERRHFRNSLSRIRKEIINTFNVDIKKRVDTI